MIEALVDHQAIRHDESLVRVGRVDKVLDHHVAPLDVLLVQVILLFTATSHGQFSLELGDLLLQPLDDDSWIHRLVSADLVLDQGDRAGEATRRQGLVHVFRLGRDGGDHLGLTVSSKRVPEDHGHHSASKGHMEIPVTRLHLLV